MSTFEEQKNEPVQGSLWVIRGCKFEQICSPYRRPKTLHWWQICFCDSDVKGVFTKMKALCYIWEICLICLDGLVTDSSLITGKLYVNMMWWTKCAAWNRMLNWKCRFWIEIRWMTGRDLSPLQSKKRKFTGSSQSMGAIYGKCKLMAISSHSDTEGCLE